MLKGKFAGHLKNVKRQREKGLEAGDDGTPLSFCRLGDDLLADNAVSFKPRAH